MDARYALLVKDKEATVVVSHFRRGWSRAAIFTVEPDEQLVTTVETSMGLTEDERVASANNDLGKGTALW